MNRPRQVCALVLGLSFFLAAAHGQYSFTDQNPVTSVSGQFVVSGVESDEPFLRDPSLAANTNAIHLKTTLLAVTAERYKASLWHELGLSANAAWSGKIYLQVHPARVLDETVTIASGPFLDHWNYKVDLPDTLSKMRYARALSAVLLLEFANRAATPGGQSAELPSWLVDGISQQLVAAAGEKLLLSAPIKTGLNEEMSANQIRLSVRPISESERGFDPFITTRRILQTQPALTFDQLSWPTDEQMMGADGGAYFASAQLFQFELMGLKNGREKMRAMLADLPNHLNWQLAFFKAFGQDFQRPLDVEKWWALRVVNFAAHAPGPQWTMDVSLARMEELLSVPVEYRGDSNALPSHAEISLQAALRSLPPEERDTVLRTKVRDLGLMELRLAPPFGGLADGYRVALADFLGEYNKPARVSITNKNISSAHYQATLEETLQKLDALDLKRRTAGVKSAINLSGNSTGGLQ